jgi:tRNA modification GTPase
MSSVFDTIVAPITGNQRAAVAWIRICGPEAFRVARAVFPGLPEEPESHRAIYGRYATGDDGLALPFAEGRSYTGDQTAELSLHGSPASVRALLGACQAAGARFALPGEFTQRAFLNGRLDLSQAEAVRDTVDAETDLQLAAANQLREGELRREITAMSDRVRKLLAAVEASVDFAEEIGELDRPSTLLEVEQLQLRTGELLRRAKRGLILRDGLRIALVGRPNAGKSSLMNALLGANRAIVTDIPGTTRDFIEEKVDLGGIPCVLVDTAGLRATLDPIEAEGISRTREMESRADRTWYLYDAVQGWTPEDEAEIARLGPKTDRIATKIDLLSTPVEGVSSVTCEGIGALVAKLKAAVDWDDHAAPPIPPRHEPILERVMTALNLAAEGLRNDYPDDLLSSAFREILAALGEITGETLAEDMVARMFADFCIGK